MAITGRDVTSLSRHLVVFKIDSVSVSGSQQLSWAKILHQYGIKRFGVRMRQGFPLVGIIE